MKLSKEDAMKLPKVEDKDLSFMIKSTNPENMKFPPLGRVITLQKDLSPAPPIFNTEPWEAVVGKDEYGNEYFIYPKHIKGEIYRNGKKLQINKLYEGSLIDFLKNMPKVKLARFSEIEVDVYNSNQTTKKPFPFYELVD